MISFQFVDLQSKNRIVHVELLFVVYIKSNGNYSGILESRFKMMNQVCSHTVIYHNYLYRVQSCYAVYCTCYVSVKEVNLRC